MICVPSTVYGRKVNQRLILPDFVLASAFVKVQAGEYAGFDLVGDDMPDGEPEVISITLLQVTPAFFLKCRIAEDFDSEAIAFRGRGAGVAFPISRAWSSRARR